jgi:hypothetical protein
MNDAKARLLQLISDEPHMGGGGFLKAVTKAQKMNKAAQPIVSAAEHEANLARLLEPSKATMRLYHGTTATEGGKGTEAIRRLKPSKEGALGSGVYMTPSSEFGSTYAGFPAKSQLDRDLLSDNEVVRRSAQQYLDRLEKGDVRPEEVGGNMLPVYAQIKNPLILEGHPEPGRYRDPMIEALTKLGMGDAQATKMVERAYDQKGYIGKEVESRARAAGYDGLMQYRNGELREVVSYNPNAIKSATGNRGTFDINDPDLSKATGGAVHMAGGGTHWSMGNPEQFAKNKSERLYPKLERMNPAVKAVKNQVDAFNRLVDQGVPIKDLVGGLVGAVPFVGPDMRKRMEGATVNFPTGFERSKKNPQVATGRIDMAPAKVSDILGELKPSDFTGTKGMSNVLHDVGRGYPPNVLDVLDTLGMDITGFGGVGIGTAIKGGRKAAGALSDLAKSETGYKLAQKVINSPYMAPMSMNVVKDTGGNWRGGSVENQLGGLLKAENLDNPEQAKALNKWISSNLTNYVKKQMATPDDPVRKLAEQGITHKPSVLDDYQDVLAPKEDRVKAGFPAEGLGQSQLARGWENASDDAITSHNAGEIQSAPQRAERMNAAKQKVTQELDTLNQKFESRIRNSGLKENEIQGLMRTMTPTEKADMIGDDSFIRANADYLAQSSPVTALQAKIMEDNPWIAKVDPNSSVYTPHLGDLGFDHITDVLNQDLAAGRIRPEQLNKISMEQAVRRTHEFDQDMAKKMRETQAKVTEGMPVYKEYPEGYKWVELSQPKDLPKGWSQEPSGAYIGPNGERTIVNPNYETLGQALKYEGDTMGHCVGGYCPDVAEGRSRIFSLRDAKGEPHVTVEVQPKTRGTKERTDWFANQPEDIQNKITEEALELEKTYGKGLEYGSRDNWQKSFFGVIDKNMGEESPSIVQIKGKQNRAPKEDYLPFVQDFVKGGQWSDVGDLRNTGLRDLKKTPKVEEYLKSKNADVPRYLTEDEYKGHESDFLLDELGKVAENDPLTQRLLDEQPRMAEGGEVKSFFDEKSAKQRVLELLNHEPNMNNGPYIGSELMPRPLPLQLQGEIANDTYGGIGGGGRATYAHPIGKDAAIRAYIEGGGYKPKDMDYKGQVNNMGISYEKEFNDGGEVHMGKGGWIGAIGRAQDTTKAAEKAAEAAAKAAKVGSVVDKVPEGVKPIVVRTPEERSVIEKFGQKQDQEAARQKKVEKAAKDSANLSPEAQVKPTKTKGPRTKVEADTYRKLAESQGDEAVLKAARAGEHLKPTSTGYVGAPRTVTSPQGLGAMRRSMDTDFADSVEAVRLADPERLGTWYDRAKQGIAESVEPYQLDRILEQHGVYSAGVSPESELGFALKHLNSRVAGKPEMAYRGAPMRNLDSAVAQNRPANMGFKIGEYANKNDPRIPNEGLFGVNDFRRAQGMGYTDPQGNPWKAGVSETMHPFMDAETALQVDRANLAGTGGRTDWAGPHIQEVPWVYGKGQDLYSRGKSGRYGGDELEGIKQSLVDANNTARDYMYKHAASATHEAIPGASLNHVPQALDMTPEAKLAYSREGRFDQLVPEAALNKFPEVGAGNRDAIYSALGYRQLPSRDASGLYINKLGGVETNPMTIARPLMDYPTGGGGLMAPESRKMMDAAEQFRALMDAQEAGAYNLPNTMAGVKSKTSMVLDTRGRNPNKLADPSAGVLPTSEQLAKMSDLMGEYGFGVTATNRGAVVFPFDPSIDPKEASKVLRKNSKALENIFPSSQQKSMTTAGYVPGVGKRSPEGPLSTAPYSGEATSDMLKIFSELHPSVAQNLSESEAVRAAIRAKALRDSKLGGTRGDIQETRRFFSEADWPKAVAMMRKGATPAAALAALGYNINAMAAEEQ